MAQMTEAEARRQTLAIAQSLTKNDPVPCQGCTACCKGGQLVYQEPGDIPWPFTAIHADTGRMCLPQTSKGDCLYLTDKGCGIYDQRPITCRTFDCRRFAGNWTPEQRAEGIERKIYSPEIFQAAQDRMHTIKRQPFEAQVDLSASVAEYLLNNARKHAR